MSSSWVSLVTFFVVAVVTELNIVEGVIVEVVGVVVTEYCCQ